MDKFKNNLYLKDSDLDFASKQELVLEVNFTKEELSIVGNIVSASPFTFKLKTYPNDANYVCNIVLDGIIELCDELTNKVKKFPININDYLIASKEDGDDVDILAEKSGYDFHGAILALFYQSVPKKFVQNYKNIHIDGVEIVSEDEYYSKKQKDKKVDSPFAKLDELDLD